MNKILKITNNIKCVIGDIDSHNKNLAAYTKKSNSEEGKSLLIFSQTFNGGVIVLNQESNLSSKDHQTINLKTITENSQNCDALIIENASQFLENNNCDISIRAYDSLSAILYDEKNDILVPIHLGRMAIINGVIGNVFDKMQTLYNDRGLDFNPENFKVEFFAGLLVQNHELKVSDLKGIIQNIIKKNPNDKFAFLEKFYYTGFFRHFYNKEELNEEIKLTGYIKSRNFKDFEEFKKELTSEINDDDKKTNIYFDPVGLALDRIYESFGENINISTEHLHDTKSDLNFKSKRRIDHCLRILEMILNNKVDNTENLKKEVLDFYNMISHIYNDRGLDFNPENFKVEFFAGLLVQNHELKVSDLKGIIQNIIKKNPNDKFAFLEKFYYTGFFRHFYNKEELNEEIKLTGYIKSRNFKDFEEFKKELTSEINDDDKKTNIYFDPVGLALDRIYESFGENINISTEHLHDTKSDLNFKSKRRIDHCLRILEMILNNKVDNTENLKKEVLDFYNMISHTYEYNYDTKSYNEMKEKYEIIIKKNIIDLSSSINSDNESDKKIKNLKDNLDNNDKIYNFFKKEIIELIDRSSDLFKDNLLKAFQDKKNTDLNKLEDSLKELNIDNESEKNYSFENLMKKFTDDNDKEFDSIIFNIIKNDYPKLEQDETKRSNHNIISLSSIEDLQPTASINNLDSLV